MLAFAMMAAIRHQANQPAPKKTAAAAKLRPSLYPLVDSGNP
jgi:SRSO17 transposase